MQYRDMSEQQVKAVNDIISNKVGCITPDCGFGKTVVGLTSFVALKKLGAAHKMLVLCTPKGIEETWSTEHKKWEHLKHLSIVSLNQPPDVRLIELKGDYEVYCLSYNSLQWLSKNKGNIVFDYVFADEGSCLKGYKSKWRSYLVNCAPKAAYRIISTATPAPHDAMDYWGLCKYLDNGECLGAKNITTFRSNYCLSIPTGSNRIRYIIKTNMIPEIEDRIKHLFFTYESNKEDIIPISTITVNAKLSKKSTEIYEKVKKSQCINSIILNVDGDINQAESLNALSLANKLAELSNGFLYVDDRLRLDDDVLDTLNTNDLKLTRRARKTIDVFDDRIMAFKKMIAGIHKHHGKDASIAITYSFKHDLIKLSEILPTGVPDTEKDIVNRWNNGEIQYLFLQYARSSKSLNLQGGGNIIAVYSPTYNWEHDYQVAR